MTITTPLGLEREASTQGTPSSGKMSINNENMEKWMMEIHVVNEANDHIHLVEAPLTYLYDFEGGKFVSVNGKMDVKKIIRWIYDFHEDEDEIHEIANHHLEELYFVAGNEMRITSDFSWKNIITRPERYGNVEYMSLPVYVVLRSERALDIFVQAGFIKTKTKGKKVKSNRDKVWKHDGKEYKIKTVSKHNESSGEDEGEKRMPRGYARKKREDKTEKGYMEDQYVTKTRGDGRYSYSVPKTPQGNNRNKIVPSDEEESSKDNSVGSNTDSEDDFDGKKDDNSSTRDSESRSISSSDDESSKRNKPVRKGKKNTKRADKDTIYSTECLLQPIDEYSISPKFFNIKTWDKIESLPAISKELPVSHWYNMVCSFCKARNLYIPPFSTLTKDTAPMGILWKKLKKDMKSEGILHYEEYWSNILFKLLTKRDYFPTVGPMATWSNIAMGSPGNGYMALYRMIQPYHPLLKTELRKVVAPVQGRGESMSLYYVNRMIDFFLLEAINHRYFEGKCIVELIISNCKEEYKPTLMQHLEKHTMPYDNSRYITGYRLELIAMTFENELSRMGHSIYQDANQGVHRYLDQGRAGIDNRNVIRLIDDENFEVLGSGTIHALVTSHGECPICLSKNHTAETCFKLSDWCRSNDYIIRNPKLQEKMIKVRPTARSNRKQSNNKLGSGNEQQGLPKHIIHEIHDANGDSDSTMKENDLEDDTTIDEENNEEQETDTYEERETLRCINMPDNHERNEVSFDYVNMEGTIQEDMDHTTTIPLCHLVDKETDAIPRAHIDDGSALNAVCDKRLLFGYTGYKEPRVIGQDAQGTKILAYGEGYARYVAKGPIEGYHDTRSYYAPGLTTNFLSVNRLEVDVNGPRSSGDKNRMSYVKKDWSAQCGYAFVKHKNVKGRNLEIPGVLVRGHVYAEMMIPTIEEHRGNYLKGVVHSLVMEHDIIGDDTKDDGELPTVHTLSTQALKILWHHRLNHVSGRRLRNLHKFGTTIPKLDYTDVADNCPICIAAKLRRVVNRTQTNNETPTSKVEVAFFQGISVDMGFIVQTSNANPDRKRTLSGLNGETCYLIIRDFYSGMIMGQCQTQKGADIDYLSNWIATHTPPVGGKFARFDKGELGNNRTVHELFRRAGYQIQVTGPDSSDQNGKVERVHQDIANGLRTSLHGAGLEAKYWPYAFHHYLHVYNMLPPFNEKKPSPLEMVTGIKPNYGDLRAFGARVYVRPPGQRPSKLHLHVYTGRFLGYSRTQKVILYRDDITGTVKTARHVQFDEGCADMSEPPPDPKRLRQYATKDEKIIDQMQMELKSCPGIDVTRESFITVVNFRISVNCEDPTFGIRLEMCAIRHRVYISNVIPSSSVGRVKIIRSRYRGAYVVQINGVPVFTLEDATEAFKRLREDSNLQDFEIVLAPEPYTPPSKIKEIPLHLGINEMLSIHALRHGTGTNMQDDLLSPNCFIYDDEEDYAQLVRHELNAIANQVVHGTPDEQALPRFTRARLKRLNTWNEWRDAEFAQLDAMEKQGMYGKPVIPPPDAIILRQHWNYSFKADGRRKARNCCDGSPRAAPNLRLEDTYSSCVEQPCVRLFLALTAQLGYVICSADATNAYANSPPPSQPTFVYIDDAYREWYRARHGGEFLNEDLVLPVQHALQGHPESGNLWEKLIHGLLVDKLNFRTTVHERNLYVGEFSGNHILGCRQVDDLLFASSTMEPLIAFIKRLGEMGIDLHVDGVTTNFNGVDILQTRQYIKLSCTSYLMRLLRFHGWDTSTDSERETPLPISLTIKEPISSQEMLRLQSLEGPMEDTAEAIALSRRIGFSYRSLLGELMYAYVVGRFDIGYCITQLAKHSQAPAEAHYQALRRIALYLRRTLDWGIYYWRPPPSNDGALRSGVQDLPDGPFQRSLVPQSSTLPPFPPVDSTFSLVGFVDAAHATDLKTRRSVSGYAFTYGGAVIAFRTKLQSTVATSSTEAEFIAAVFSAKVAKYLRSVLTELGYPCVGATPPLYEDNAAAIYMANHGRPTERSRHIDIQYFALQEWCAQGDVVLQPIQTSIQPADILTKACGPILHFRHSGRLMGFFLPSTDTPIT